MKAFEAEFSHRAHLPWHHVHAVVRGAQAHIIAGGTQNAGCGCGNVPRVAHADRTRTVVDHIHLFTVAVVTHAHDAGERSDAPSAVAHILALPRSYAFRDIHDRNHDCGESRLACAIFEFRTARATAITPFLRRTFGHEASALERHCACAVRARITSFRSSGVATIVCADTRPRKCRVRCYDRRIRDMRHRSVDDENHDRTEEHDPDDSYQKSSLHLDPKPHRSKSNRVRMFMV